jgi:hypothetical protein
VKTCECQVVNGDDANYCTSCGRRLPETVDAVAAPAPSVTVDPVVAAQRQRRILVIVGSFVALAMVAAIGLTIGLRNVHIDIGSNHLVSVRLPLNVCKTSVGSPSDTPADLPANVRVRLAPGYSTKLAVYSDNEGVIEVVAPTGWNCTAQIAGDGSSSVQVSPPGQAGISSATLSAGSTDEVINASQTSACVGCRESLACPLFDSAANAYRSIYQHACPARRPPSEVVTDVSADVVEFTDPPGVRGDAVPSGGEYPALGVMTYHGDKNNGGSWTETCVLPATHSSMCKAIVANFDAKYGQR